MTAAADPLNAYVKAAGPAPTPQQVVDVLVPEVADLAAIFLKEGDRLGLAAFQHLNPRQLPLLEKVQRVHAPRVDDEASLVAEVVRTGEGVLLPWIDERAAEQIQNPRIRAIFKALGATNVMVVPLPNGVAVHGALVLAISGSGRQFTRDDLEFAAEFARRGGPILKR